MTQTDPSAKQMSYKARRRWALLALLVGMPVYIVIAVNLMASIDRLPFWAEMVAYVVLGTAWIFPLKRVFLGVGQPDPDAAPATDEA